MEETVVVYSAKWCPWCRQTLEYLDSLGIGYEVRDVDVGDNAKRLMAISGQSGVPLLCKGSDHVIGFDPGRIDKLVLR